MSFFGHMFFASRGEKEIGSNHREVRKLVGKITVCYWNTRSRLKTGVNFVSRGLRNRPGVLLYRKRIFYKGMHSHWILIDETHCEILSISQFQLRPLPLPRATAGHWPALSVPGVGHLQILCCPGAGHLPTPRPFPSFWHARGFLSEYNYTEGFTGKKADWLICQGQE